MAVVKIPQASTLGIKVQTGISPTGSPVFKTFRFGSVKPGALDADIFAVGQALAGLQKHSVTGLIREDNGELLNQ